ncbi:hypothetical protein NDU88_000405 [Pleurodeles waltl]|uniref:Uncharacterized protein n=1 Tax=Pleurodeles waltl TaxID=8319 RepID=A0AAV7VWI2_PLEWA|nr:hypothetical protein NDU88_000405 [Pleurodeles waltl]
MGTPTDPSIPDFQVSQAKERTDWIEREEKFPPEMRKTEPTETPHADTEENGPEGIPEPRGEDPKGSQDSEACTFRHDPGGSWLTKVESLLGRRQPSGFF